MSFQMCSHVSAFGESFPTIVTLIGLFACVSPDVNLKGARSHEGLIAMLANEGPLS